MTRMLIRQGPFIAWLLIAIAVVLAVVSCEAMAGQLTCGPRGEVKADLEQKYDEQTVAQGLSPDGLLIEVFASPAGTFTVTASNPQGFTCLLAAGEAWTTNMVEKGGGI